MNFSCCIYINFYSKVKQDKAGDPHYVHPHDDLHLQCMAFRPEVYAWCQRDIVQMIDVDTGNCVSHLLIFSTVYFSVEFRLEVLSLMPSMTQPFKSCRITTRLLQLILVCNGVRFFRDGLTQVKWCLLDHD